jgi:hypothetical protein
MYFPSAVISPNDVVVVVTGHSVLLSVDVVLVVLVVFSSTFAVSLLSRCAVCVVRQLASTRVPLQVEVVVVVSVLVSRCAL